MKEEMGKMNGLNAEAVFSDVLDLVLDAAKEAPVERSAREMFYRHIIGDISAALASVAPVERVGDKPLDLKKSGKGKFSGSSMRVARTPHSVVFQCVLPSGRSLSALLSDGGHAYMYDGNDYVCDITFAGKYKGLNWAYPIVRKAMNGLVSKAGKASRNRSNRQEVV